MWNRPNKWEMWSRPNKWAGDDSLIGGDRTNVLRGQGGDDLLTGGRGSDVFRFESTRARNGFDTITDYTWGPEKRVEKDSLDLSAVRFVGAREDSLGDYVWLVESKAGATLYVDPDGQGSSAPEAWALLEGLASGDRVQVRLDVDSGWGADGAERYLLTVREGPDETAPTFGEQTLIAFTYDENREAGDVLGALVATDNVEVTGYRFCDESGEVYWPTSPDNWFAVDADGTIRMTPGGVASPAANDYESAAVPFYFVQAGDAAGNWSKPALLILTVQDVFEDLQAPTFGGEIEVKYDENREAGDALGTLAATDDVGVTGYRFCDGAGNDLGTTSPDGAFSVDADGTIRMTVAGAASAVNDYENGPPPPLYLVQAGDAAGNWSAPERLRMVKQDVLEDDRAPFLDGPISVYYTENQKPTVLVTLAAIDNVGVTGYRFCDGDGMGLGTTSPDGFFSVDADGNFSMTAEGAMSSANDYESIAPPPAYLVQAGDAAGNWSIPQWLMIGVLNDDMDDGMGPMPF